MTDAQTEARAIAERWWIELGFVNDRLNQTPILANLIATALAAKDAELAKQIEARDDAIDDLQQKWWFQSDRADRAEAQLAEANKALEPFALLANSFDGIPPPKYFGDTDGELRYPNEHKTLVEISKLRAARRAREAQGGQNG